MENDSRENEEELSMRSLWRGVITQALMDAASNSKKRSEKAHKQKAIQWLLYDMEDFINVCNLAEMDYQYVRKQAFEALARGCYWRKDKRRTKISCNINMEYVK